MQKYIMACIGKFPSEPHKRSIWALLAEWMNVYNTFILAKCLLAIAGITIMLVIQIHCNIPSDSQVSKSSIITKI